MALRDSKLMTLTSAERRNFKRQSIGEIEAILGGLGWVASSWRGTGRCFTQGESVTPYLLISAIAGRRWGSYVIEGSLGILHRPFEQFWASAGGDNSDADQFTLSLHTANFSQLNDSRYIDPGKELRPQVVKFCEAALNVLMSLPASETGLAAAYHEDQLAGHPFASYLAHGVIRPAIREKHLAFKRYLDER